MAEKTSGKSLGHEANERLRKIVQSFVDQDFGGNRTAAAKRLGVSQSLVQEFLEESRGAGVKLITAISAYTGRPMDELLGKAPAARTVERDDRYPTRPVAVAFAIACGDPPAIAESVYTIALQSTDDPGAQFWLDEIRSRVRASRIATADPHEVSAAKAAASRPKLPTRRKP